MKQIILDKLSKYYTLKQRDLNDFEHMSRYAIDYYCEAYDIQEVGNLFFIEAKAPFDFMHMLTIVINPLYKDLSFCNFDTVQIPNKQSYIFEMFKTSINKDEDISGFGTIRQRYEDLPDFYRQHRWYDEYLLECSLHKQGNNITNQAQNMLIDCLDEYIKLLQSAKDCDYGKKKEIVKEYVDKLLSQGGVAIDGMKKMFGDEKTDILIRKYMYNV